MFLARFRFVVLILLPTSETECLIREALDVQGSAFDDLPHYDRFRESDLPASRANTKARLLRYTGQADFF